MDNAQTLVERWWAAFEAGNLDGALELTTPDCEMRMPGVAVRGRENIKPILQAYLTAFPDLRHATLTSTAAGEVVAVELEIKMTHTGPFQTPQGTVPASGKKVVLRTCDVITARNGRITSWHAYFDNMEMLGQLGLLPPA